VIKRRVLFFVSSGIAVLILAIGGGNPPFARGQASAIAAPQFEVASIKLSRKPEPGGDVQITPGRFKGKDLALQWLILTAYRIKSGDLAGELPAWTISERYDIDAKTGDGSGEDRVLLALRALLKDRFHLREHREMKDEPVYFLTIGSSGAKMPPGNCVPVKQDLPNECYSTHTEGLLQTLDWRGVRMSDPSGIAYRSLAWALSGPLRRAVIDKTGLAGTFDVHLRWSRDPEPPDNSAAPAAAADLVAVNPNAPALSTAIEEQLGLKLEAGRGPVEHLIVDHVEKPGEN
jgi:uncharacterized protein (TIGR03435 family)